MDSKFEVFKTFVLLENGISFINIEESSRKPYLTNVRGAHPSSAGVFYFLEDVELCFIMKEKEVPKKNGIPAAGEGTIHFLVKKDG